MMTRRPTGEKSTIRHRVVWKTTCLSVSIKRRSWSESTGEEERSWTPSSSVGLLQRESATSFTSLRTIAEHTQAYKLLHTVYTYIHYSYTHTQHHTQTAHYVILLPWLLYYIFGTISLCCCFYCNCCWNVEEPKPKNFTPLYLYNEMQQ